ncbi:MAG TPA: DUF1800 family protein [Cyclobacteriaceae bacterium]
MRHEQINLGLEPYDGEWNKLKAGHLLRRVLFGPTIKEINYSIDLGLSKTLSKLVYEVPPKISPPINYYFENDPNTPIGEPWINKKYSSDFVRRNCLKVWMIDNFLNQKFSIQQKITLFWMNHFAVQASIVKDARGVYELIDLFQRAGLGNIKSLLRKVTVSQAMLIYLNGNTNVAEAPNENYARELFELYTIGKGPLKGKEDYTNFTERDIQEAAKVLSGYITKKNPKKAVKYISRNHFKGEKSFSYIYDYAVIENNEEKEYELLIDMIFNKEETAKHICRKIYRWFVYYKIDDNVERYIITKLSKILITNNYEIKPVLKTLLNSEHFFDSQFMGAQIKSPVDFTVGFLRQLQVEFPVIMNDKSSYELKIEIYRSLFRQNQDILDPPDVAGWRAYYQEPIYYRYWMSPSTLSERDRFIKRVMRKNGITKKSVFMRIDPLNVLEEIENADDPKKVVTTFIELLIAFPLSSIQIDAIEKKFTELSSSKWNRTYRKYLENPYDVDNKNYIKSRLNVLIQNIIRLPHFQLC